MFHHAFIDLFVQRLRDLSEFIGFFIFESPVFYGYE